jgi:hypothetical protein
VVHGPVRRGDGGRHLHRLAAIVTVVYWTAEWCSVGMVVRARGKNLRGPGSMMFGKKDLEDLVGMFSWFFGRGHKPQFDRYTYWEKFDYVSLTIGTVIIGLTGFMMWFPLETTELLPGIFLNIALVIHSNEALLAMGVIFIFVHFFSAHLRPESFPIDKVIFTGTLPVDHYRQDRPLEYARACAGTLDDVLVGTSHLEDPVLRRTLVDHHPRHKLRGPAHDGVHHLVGVRPSHGWQPTAARPRDPKVPAAREGPRVERTPGSNQPPGPDRHIDGCAASTGSLANWGVAIGAWISARSWASPRRRASSSTRCCSSSACRGHRRS